jgi:group I intron endonuclease
MRPIILNKSGIYKIVNKLNGDFYIGQSYQFWKRKSDHWYRLTKSHHDNPHLQCAWNKYGGENFEFVPILVCEKEELTYYEQKCVDIFKPHYNIRKKCIDSNAGIKFSEEALKNMSKGHAGYKTSEETKEKLSRAFMGKTKISDEGKRKLSEFHKNLPEETRRKLSIAAKRQWEKHRQSGV